jgi:hypothetical protein
MVGHGAAKKIRILDRAFATVAIIDDRDHDARVAGPRDVSGGAPMKEAYGDVPRV